MAEKAGIKVVANERYGPKDTTALAQALKMIAAKPDAMMVAGVGADAAMPHSQLVDSGFKGPIFQTHGASSGAFLQIGGKKVEGALIMGPLVVVPDEIPDSAPSKAVTLDLIKGYEKAFGSKPPIFAAGTYDAGLLLSHAIPIAAKKGKPGTQEFRSALRDALESTKELKGSQGPINMSATDHSGYDLRGQVMITVKDGKFTASRTEPATGRPRPPHPRHRHEPQEPARLDSARGTRGAVAALQRQCLQRLGRNHPAPPAPDLLAAQIRRPSLWPPARRGQGSTSSRCPPTATCMPTPTAAPPNCRCPPKIAVLPAPTSGPRRSRTSPSTVPARGPRATPAPAAKPNWSASPASGRNGCTKVLNPRCRT
jgi:hypothetical protein